MTTCDHGIRLDAWCEQCESAFAVQAYHGSLLRRMVDTDEGRRATEALLARNRSRAGWLIPLILIAVAVAAVAWRLR